MTIAQALDIAETHLQESCPKPRFEAELLLAHHLGKERLYLHIHGDETVEDIDDYHALIKRREAHEPYEYIVGSASFYGYCVSGREGCVDTQAGDRIAHRQSG